MDLYPSMVGVLSGEELLKMHELLDQRPCSACVGTGIQIGLVADMWTGDIVGMAVGGECGCCLGLGFHFIRSLS